MIAPLRQQDPPSIPPNLRAARRLVASVLLRRGAAGRAAAPVSAWRAWLWVAWLGAVIGAYAGHMLGWF